MAEGNAAGERALYRIRAVDGPCYYMARQPEQGDEIVSTLLRRSDEWLSWINTIKLSRRAGSLYNRYTWMQTMEQALVVAEQFERTEFIHQYIKQYEYYNKQYQ